MLVRKGGRLPGAQPGNGWMGALTSHTRSGILDPPFPPPLPSEAERQELISVFPDRPGHRWCVLQRVNQDGRTQRKNHPGPQPAGRGHGPGVLLSEVLSLSPAPSMASKPVGALALLGACCLKNGDGKVASMVRCLSPGERWLFPPAGSSRKQWRPTCYFNVVYVTPTMENVPSKRSIVYSFSQ